MKHWHRCRRWIEKGLVCPFSGMAAHERDDEEDQEHDTRPLITAPKRAQDKEPGNRGARREGLLAGAGDLPTIEDMVAEVLRELPDREPVPPMWVPPGRAPRPPLRPAPRIPTVPVPAIPPLPVPVPVGVPAFRQAAARATNYLYQGPWRVETVYARWNAALAEDVAARVFGGEPFVPDYDRPIYRRPKPKPVWGRPRAGAGGFMFNATAMMEQMIGIGGGGLY